MKYFAYAIIGIVAIAIISGFFIVGSPQEARLRKADEQRIQHLEKIQWEIVEYWRSKEELPKQLSDLNDVFSGFSIPRDPEREIEYEYIVHDSLSFELCTTFNRPARSVGENSSRSYVSKPYPLEPWIAETWEHGEGHVCFERTIDPELYPPFK